MVDASLLKSTTRHVRVFTARVEDGELIADPSQLCTDPPVLEVCDDTEPSSEEMIEAVRAAGLEAAGADDPALLAVGNSITLSIDHFHDE